jgi:hypothetical protein
VHVALAEAVRKVQGSNLQCDDMWQTWVDTFGKGKVFDPMHHEAEFLMAFLQHAETVQLTLAMHKQLSEQIMLRTIKVECPEYIWMSAPSYDALSEWYKDHICDLTQRAPGWEVFFVSDERMQAMISKRCSEREQMCGPAKADFGRYLPMRRYGGIWLDKSGWQRDLSKYLVKFGPLPPLVLGHWGWPSQHEHIPQDVHNYGEIQQWWLMSAPGHAMWDKVLAAVCDNIKKDSITTDGVGKQAVITVTGPVEMTRVMYPELLERCPHLLLKDREYKFEYDIFGTHAKEQNQLGGHATHYSKLEEPVILPISAGSSSSAVPAAPGRCAFWRKAEARASAMEEAAAIIECTYNDKYHAESPLVQQAASPLWIEQNHCV